MALNLKKLGPNGIQIEAVATSTIDTKGELEVIDSLGTLQYHDGTAVRKVLLDTFSGNITITGDLSVTGQATIDNLNLNGNTLSSTDVDGGIIIDPNGNGDIDLTVSGTGVINLGSSSITIDASGIMTISGQLNIDNLRFDSNTISSTDTDGNIVLSPNGTGDVVVDSLSVSLPIKTGASKELVSGAIDLDSAEVTGILPVANGGTGSATQNFVDLTTNQSVDGTKTFLDPITIDPVSNQLVLGNTNTITINASAPAASRVITIPDVGTNADVVLTEGNQTISGNKVFAGDVQAQQDVQLKIAADNASTGNQSVVSTDNSSIIRFTNNTGPTVQGLANGLEAKLLIISYTGSGSMIVQNESGSASASDRIITGTGGDVSLDPGASLWLYYDSTSSRWRVVGGSGGIKALVADRLTLTASGTIAVDTAIVLQSYRVQGDSAAVTLSTTPFGASAPADGTTITLIGNDSNDTVTITNNDIAKGCILNGDATLTQYDSITLRYLSSVDRYIEINRNF